jgi:hypothetical protein
MRKYLSLVILTCYWSLSPGPMLYAQQDQATDMQAVIERGNHLKTLLDQLLSETNHSSIHKALDERGETADPLIEEAIRLKSDGEQLLAQEDYVKAAMRLQSALDMVFQAIRSSGSSGDAEKDSSSHMVEVKAVNDTFITAATRVVEGDPNDEAVELLASARSARARAEDSEAKSDTEAALQELESSTQLAQKAIMSVRNGMVIQRRQ